MRAHAFAVALLIAGCGGSSDNSPDLATAAQPDMAMGSCNLVGTWGTTASGAPFSFTFATGGTYTTMFNGSAGKSGMWMLNGTTFQIQDSSCTQFGSYTLTFASSCNGFTLATISDSCSGRPMFYNGLSFTRM
jgi:hypothetical protein